ncbi:MAG: branched-chain amino acid aminotransferase, partial [Planctomycetes bacterium]|nr:branched-chain amino acid aminotransferase [Planctomycetota bacterium]
MTTTWAYLNGRWIPDTELAIGVDDLGFLVGATVTERLRTFRGQVFRLDEHLSRLRHSLEIVRLPAEHIAKQIGDAVL